MTPVVLLTAALAGGLADNPVARLGRRLAAGEPLAWSDKTGRLPAVLAALDVPVSSQVLVFSRTSLQTSRIGPRTPRAIYFNDEVLVGFCRRGDVLELAAADPHAGTAFYTLEQTPDAPLRFVRQTDACFACHAGSATDGRPGHLLRSVWPDRRGDPVLSRGSTRVDPTTPLADRWGGWYVSGTGAGPHRGNRVVGGWAWADPDRPPPADEVSDLSPFFATGAYLSPHSDVVALLVLEHQCDALNRMTRLAATVRQSLVEQAALNKLDGKPADAPWEGITRRIERACEPLVEAMLFCDEVRLPGPVAGTSGFASEFAARGPTTDGRSLRQFDLRTRLFRHPLSYLIYSHQFEGLPAVARARVYHRLGELLSGTDTSPRFAHLSAADRRACADILLATKPGLPAGWPGGRR